MKQQSLLLCLFGLSLVLSQKTRQKDCDLKKFDENPVNVFSQFGLDSLRFPETRGQLSQYCRNTLKSIRFGKQYGDNCLEGTSKNLMSASVRDFDVVNRQFCTRNGRLRDRFVSWAKCANRAKNETKECWNELMTIMANIKSITDTNLRLPTICCIYYHWMWCNDYALGSVGRVCGSEARKGFDDYVRSSTADSMNQICSQYENSHNACEPYLSQAIRTISKQPFLKTPLLYVFEHFNNQ